MCTRCPKGLDDHAIEWRHSSARLTMVRDQRRMYIRVIGLFTCALLGLAMCGRSVAIEPVAVEVEDLGGSRSALSVHAKKFARTSASKTIQTIRSKLG